MLKIFISLERMKSRFKLPFVNLFLLLSVLWLWLVVFPGVVSAQQVTIPDQKLRDVILQELRSNHNKDMNDPNISRMICES